jgi:hypothetical protein
MANETGNTQLDVIIPELWQPKILAAIYDSGKVIPRVTSVSGEVEAKGDRIHLPNMPTITVNTVGASGSVTNQTVTPTEAILVVDTWVESTMTLVDLASKQSNGNIVDDFYNGAGDALRQKMDLDLLALATDANFSAQTAQGDGSTPLDEDALAGAVGTMMSSKFADGLNDPERATFFIHSGEWRNLKKIGAFSHARVLGTGEYSAVTGKLPDFYGIKTVLSTQVRTSGSVRYNLLALREALAIGIQSNITVLELPRADLARRFNMNALYGVKVRIDRGCLIKSST